MPALERLQVWWKKWGKILVVIVLIILGALCIAYFTGYHQSSPVHFSSDVSSLDQPSSDVPSIDLSSSNVPNLDHPSSDVPSLDLSSSDDPIDLFSSDIPSLDDPNPVNFNTSLCNGTIQNAENTTIYRNRPVEPLIEIYSTLEKDMFKEMFNLYNRSRNVILDCSVFVDPPSASHSYYNYAFLRALSKFNNDRSIPMKFWLLLDIPTNGSINITHCSDAISTANSMFRGSDIGILGNSKSLLASASSTAELTAKFNYKSNMTPCGWYTEQCIDRLNAQGVKFGLMLHPHDCPMFSALVPDPLIRKFDEIFYFEGERLEMLIGDDKVRTLTASNEFIKCRDIVAEMVPEAKAVKYVIAEKYEAMYPYCLKFV